MTSHVDVAASTSSEAEPRGSLLMLSVMVAAVAVMASSLSGPFIFDDVALIRGNDRIHDFSQWHHWFSSTLWDTNYDPSEMRHTRGFWRPIVLLSYAVDWKIGGGSPLMFHITNLVLHAVNACLLLRVLRGWLESGLAALLGALLFAVHPAQTESVAWIAGRTDSLCVLGLLVAVMGLRCWREQRALGGALLCAGLATAFASKEAAVVFPVLATLEIWSVRRSPLTAATIRGLLSRVAPFAALSVAFFVVHRLFVPASSSFYPLTAMNRVLLPLEALGRYVILLAWPGDLTLGRATIPVVNGALEANAAYVLVGVLAAAAIAIGGWRLRSTRPGLALGLLGSAAMILPVMTVVWLGYDVTASPRFLYVPMIGLAFTAGELLKHPFAAHPAARGAVLVVLAAFGFRSFLRSADYSDADLFWSREIASNERYLSAQQYLITKELQARRPESALRLAHKWFADPLGSAVGKAALVRNAVAASLDLTPDTDTDSIERIQRFAAALAANQAGELVVRRLNLELRLPAGSPLLHLVRGDRRHYLLFSANAASRLGDDATAVQHVDSALEGCGECWTILPTGALIVARAGQLERARVLLEQAQRVGPPGSNIGEALDSLRQAVHWRTTVSEPTLRQVGFYSALGAFGRAYKVVQPILDGIAANPETIPRLAELALLAGDETTARSLLQRRLSTSDAEAQLAELYKRVRWRDQPSG